MDPLFDFDSVRTAQDVLLGRLPLRLAGKVHVLPVLTTGQNREWQEALDGSLTPLLSEDATSAELLEAMARIDLLAFIYSYDLMGVLPPRASIEDDVYPHEKLMAVQEVRLATNPTLAYAIAMTMDEARTKVQSALSAPPLNRAQRRSRRTSSPRRPTAGRTSTSATT